MRLVDTHCHLDFPDYKEDLAGVLYRAEKTGVVRVIVPGTTAESSTRAVELADKYEMVFASCGIHPHDADNAGKKELDKVFELALNNEKVVAIGEVGLDYFKKYSSIENQKKLFKWSLEMAKELDKPVIVHNREAGEDIVDILKSSGFKVRGVVHCFSGDANLLKEILDLGMYVSFTGNITFPKADDLREVARQVPPEKLLLETDSPYITPKPFRGKRNEPAYVKYLLGVYKDMYGLTEEDVARITTHNANELFKLGLEGKAVITYAIRDKLYINLTNRCTNKCTFCTRQASDYVKGHKLKDDREPSAKEIIEELGDISGYEEIVFCGYGEPTLRLETIKEVASFIKSKGGTVRLTTNGAGNLINSRDITGELKGLIDRVSVSLNAPDKKGYIELCKPVFGEKSYGSMMDFIKGCRSCGLDVEITCLDIIGEDGVQKCQQIAADVGASFRLREMNVVG